MSELADVIEWIRERCDCHLLHPVDRGRCKACEHAQTVERAVDCERERCAKVAELWGWRWGGNADDSMSGGAAKYIAAEIRKDDEPR